MKEKSFKKGIEELKKIRMTKTEKDFVLTSILGQPIKTPYSFGTPIFAFVRSHRITAIIVAILILALTGNGIASAAENSLPGDTLYPIKTSIIEPAKVALADTPAKKAKVQIAIATARLEEAETLAAQNKLDDQKAAELTRSLEDNSNAIAQTLNSSSIATSSQAVSATASDIEIDYQATLSAHSRILDSIAPNATVGSSTDARKKIADRAKALSNKPILRKDLQESPLASSSTQPTTLVQSSDYVSKKQHVQKIVEDTLTQMQSSADNVDSLDQGTINNVKETVDQAQAQIDQADIEITHGNSKNAHSSLRGSEKSIKEAAIIFNAGIKKAGENDRTSRVSSMRP